MCMWHSSFPVWSTRLPLTSVQTAVDIRPLLDNYFRGRGILHVKPENKLQKDPRWTNKDHEGIVLISHLNA